MARGKVPVVAEPHVGAGRSMVQYPRPRLLQEGIVLLDNRYFPPKWRMELHSGGKTSYEVGHRDPLTVPIDAPPIALSVTSKLLSQLILASDEVRYWTV